MLRHVTGGGRPKTFEVGSEKCDKHSCFLMRLEFAMHKLSFNSVDLALQLFESLLIDIAAKETTVVCTKELEN